MGGTRKRETVVAHLKGADKNPDVVSYDQSGAQDTFRKYFETAFEPLPVETKILKQRQDLDAEDENGDRDGTHSETMSQASEWSGISGSSDGREAIVEVIDHTTTSSLATGDENNPINRIFQRSFMRSGIPKDVALSSGSNNTPVAKDAENDDATETLNLKHDLALQRLLSESHLLHKTVANPTQVTNERHRTTDLRLQSVGSRASLFAQDKMPMAHRRGIVSKQNRVEKARRLEAKENGIVLENRRSPQGGRATASPKTRPKHRRERAVDAPGVGRFTGGTLKLSRRDVESIQGPARGAKKRGKRQT